MMNIGEGYLYWRQFVSANLHDGVDKEDNDGHGIDGHDHSHCSSGPLGRYVVSRPSEGRLPRQVSRLQGRE